MNSNVQRTARCFAFVAAASAAELLGGNGRIKYTQPESRGESKEKGRTHTQTGRREARRGGFFGGEFWF